LKLMGAMFPPCAVSVNGRVPQVRATG
jgi:hypothetical protein